MCRGRLAGACSAYIVTILVLRHSLFQVAYVGDRVKSPPRRPRKNTVQATFDAVDARSRAGALDFLVTAHEASCGGAWADADAVTASGFGRRRSLFRAGAVLDQRLIHGRSMTSEISATKRGRIKVNKACPFNI